MNDFLSGAADILKLAPRYLAPIGLVAGMLLFLPEGWLEAVGVAQLAKDQRQWIGLAFLFCSAAVLIGGVKWAWSPFGRMFRRRKRNEGIRQRLLRLTEAEKQILRYYVAHGTRTNTLRVDDGVVQGLAAGGIIYRAASMGNLVEGFAFNIGDVAWDVVNSDPDILMGTTDVYRTDQRERQRW